MDFARTDEQQEVAALAGRILTDLVTVDRLRAAETDDADRFDREVWRALADAGLLGIALPAEHGGGGFGVAEGCLVLEQVGRTVAPVPVLSHGLAAMALAEHGPADAH